MRIASYAFWFVAPLSFGSLALTGAACSDSSETTPVVSEAGAETGTSGEAGAKDTGTAQDPDSGPACKLSQPVSNAAVCNTCAQESCCAEINACTEDQDCQAFIACAAGCLEDAGVALDGGGSVDAGSAAVKACSAACQKAHSSGVALYQSFSVCLQGTCKSECFP